MEKWTIPWNQEEGSVTSKEWLRVGIVSFFLACLFSALYWFTYWQTPEEWQFLGEFKNSRDRNIYFGWLVQIAQGKIFLQNLFTSVPHEGAVFNLYFYVIGLPAYLFGWSLDLCMELGRFVSAILLSFAVYGFVALFFSGKARWVAWIAVIFTGGFGLFTLPFKVSEVDPAGPSTDIWIYESQPFASLLYATLFPISLASLIFTLRLFVQTIFSKRIKYAVFAGLMVFVTSLIHPYNAILILAILGAAIFFLMYWKAQNWRDWMKLFSIIVFLGVPSLIYNYWIVSHNPGLCPWLEHKVNRSPFVWAFLIGGGLPCFFSLCWFFSQEIRFRVIRCFTLYALFVAFLILFTKFCPWIAVVNVVQFLIAPLFFVILVVSGLGRKDIQWTSPVLFIIAWLVVSTPLLYCPIEFQRRFCTGLSVPFAILFVKWLQEYYGKDQWLEPKYLRLVILWLFAASIFSVVRYGWEYTFVFRKRTPLQQTCFIPKEKIAAFSYLERGEGYETVLSSFDTGNQIPRFTALPVVIGASEQTDNCAQTKQLVADFFSGRMTQQERMKFLKDRHVCYIFYGPEEKALDPKNAFPEWAGNNGCRVIFGTEKSTYRIFALK